jgi:soluble lytic murein transglycosylase-like protein
MHLRCTSTTRNEQAGRRPSARRLAALLLSGLLSAFASPGASFAQPGPDLGTDQAATFAAHIDEASRRFRVPAAWIRAVMSAESAHDVRAVSSASAMGLMQVMPETWLELRARYGLGRDPFDPRANILAGAAYLREMYDRYGTVSAMLAAYNAGPRRYDEYVAGTRALPAETCAYVAAIVPLLGIDPLASTASSARIDPLAWMSAALFVSRSDDAQRPNGMRPERQRDDAENARRAQDGDALSARSPGLFVTRHGSERPQ